MNNRITLFTINNITDLISNIREGDMLIFDIDHTLLLTGINKYTDKVIITEKDLVQQIKLLFENNIPIIVLTAREKRFASETKAQLTALGINCNTIIHAPTLFTDKQEKLYQKGIELKKYLDQLEHKPKRLIIIDDKKNQLTNIATIMQQDSIPIALYRYQRKIHQEINKAKKTIHFPEDLKHFTEIKSLGGGTASTYLITNPITKQQLVIKYGTDPEAIQLEIVCNALYQVLDVPVPAMHVYKSLPRRLAKQIKASSLHGIFQVSEYIQSTETIIKSKQVAREHFVTHVLLGNIDVAKEDNFIGDKLIDAGANFFRRALGEKRIEDASILSEISSLRDQSINSKAYEWFSSLTENELKIQAKHILAKSQQLEEVVRKVTLEVDMADRLRQQFIQYLADRLDKLEILYALDERPKARIDKKVSPATTAAGVLTYKFMNNEYFILLSRRARHNWFDNFGGKTDLHDKSFADTAAREVGEESSEQLLYQAQELDSSPFHDLITVNDKGEYFTYRMYMMPDNGANLIKITDSEHTHHQYFHISLIMDALNKNKIIRYENQETIAIADTYILYPPLYHMLQQTAVKENLERLLKGKALKKTQTQGLISHPYIQPVTQKKYVLRTLTEDQKQIATKLQTHSKMIQELKKRNKQVITLTPQEIAKAQPLVSQSELYLKAIMGADYQDGELEQNIRLFFKKYKPISQKITVDKIERVITQCINLVEAEKTDGDRYFYFYHGCDNRVTFAYYIYTLIYETLQLNDSWPVFRGVRKHFQRFIDINQFIDYYSKQGTSVINNNDVGYKDCAISSNIFLFGNHETDTSYSLEYYINNTVMTNISLQGILEDLLNPFAISSFTIKKLLNIFDQYAKEEKGSLYQIKIPKELVTQYAYPAGRLGCMHKLEDKQDLNDIITLLSKKISNNTDDETLTYIKRLQARLFLPPELPFETKHIKWDETDYLPILRNTIEPVISAIVYNTHLETDAINSHLPLFRIIKDACIHANVPMETNFTESTLIEAILRNDETRINAIFTKHPAMKLSKLPTPTLIKKVYFEKDISACQLMINHAKFSIEFITKCFGEEWWKQYDSKYLDEYILILKKIKKEKRKQLLDYLDQLTFIDYNISIHRIVRYFSKFTFSEVTAIVRIIIKNKWNKIEIIRVLSFYNQIELIGLVLKEANYTPEELEAILVDIVLEQDDNQLLDVLLKFDIDINRHLSKISYPRFQDGNKTLLQAAAIRNKPKIINSILRFTEANPTPAFITSQAMAFAYAIDMRNLKAIEALLQSPHTHPNYARMTDKKTPLHLLIQNYTSSDLYPDLFNKILEMKDIDLNATDKDGDSALHLAIKYGCTSRVEALLKKCPIVDVNLPTKNSHAQSPLYLAVKNKNINIVKALLKTPGIKVNFPRTELFIRCHSAEKTDNDYVIEMPPYDTSPFYLALQLQDHDIIRVLLQHLKEEILSTPENLLFTYRLVKDDIFSILSPEDILILANNPTIISSFKNLLRFLDHTQHVHDICYAIALRHVDMVNSLPELADVLRKLKIDHRFNYVKRHFKDKIQTFEDFYLIANLLSPKGIAKLLKLCTHLSKSFSSLSFDQFILNISKLHDTENRLTYIKLIQSQINIIQYGYQLAAVFSLLEEDYKCNDRILGFALSQQDKIEDIYRLVQIAECLTQPNREPFIVMLADKIHTREELTLTTHLLSHATYQQMRNKLPIVHNARDESPMNSLLIQPFDKWMTTFVRAHAFGQHYHHLQDAVICWINEKNGFRYIHNYNDFCELLKALNKRGYPTEEPMSKIEFEKKTAKREKYKFNFPLFSDSTVQKKIKISEEDVIPFLKKLIPIEFEFFSFTPIWHIIRFKQDQSIETVKKYESILWRAGLKVELHSEVKVAANIAIPAKLFLSNTREEIVAILSKSVATNHATTFVNNNIHDAALVNFPKI